VSIDILIVQNEPLKNEMIVRNLSLLGYKTVSVLHTQEATNLLKEARPALILSDDISLLQNLSCAFVLIAKYDEIKKIAQASRLGAFDFTLKHFEKNIFENVFAWIEVGRSLKKLSADRDYNQQMRMIHFFKKKFSEFQEAF
jgi:DNA-binding NtrC family response regulator